MLQLILGIFGVILGIAVLSCIPRTVKGFVTTIRNRMIFREVCDRVTNEIRNGMAASQVTFDQFDYLVVSSGSVKIKTSWEIAKAMGLSALGTLDYQRKNGGKVHLRDLKQQQKLAKRLISGLGLTDYTYVKRKYAFSSKESYTSTLKDTASGVEVTTRPTVYGGDEILICRKDRVEEFAPKKVKDYYL